MSSVAVPTRSVRSTSRLTKRLIAVALISVSLFIGGAKTAEAAIIPYTKGSEFWYSWVYLNGRLYSAGNVQYSWSWMWYLNSKKDYVSTLSTAACGALPKVPAVACAALVGAYWVYLKGQIATALKYKQCLRFRFGLPPLGALQVAKISRVTCTR